MKYSLILLVVTSSTIMSVIGKIPDYIHVCKQNDPQINKCVYNSILNMKDELVEGIPGLGVPTIDPLYLERLDLKLGPGFTAEGRDLVLTGGKNFEIRDLVVDIKANTCTFTVFVPEVIATGTFEIDANVGALPIKGKGPMDFTARSATARGTLHGKKVARGGKTFNWYPTMNMKLQIDDYDMRLRNLFEGDSTIGDVINKLLNEEKAEVLGSMLPGLEKALIGHILLAANNIAKNFSWDELFPES